MERRVGTRGRWVRGGRKGEGGRGRKEGGGRFVGGESERKERWRV